jgi:CNT family concentrative nucleoside transporter
VAWAGSLVGWQINASRLLGYVVWPAAWLMGVPVQDCTFIAELLGTKLIVNEFVAFEQLGARARAGLLSERAVAVATCALCGSSNLRSSRPASPSPRPIYPNLPYPMASHSISSHPSYPVLSHPIPPHSILQVRLVRLL